MKIEVVTHCWAVEHPLFAAALRFHLTSMLAYSRKDKREADVQATICFSTDDALVRRVIREFAFPSKFRLNPIALSVPRMTRRCIGRNVAAKQTDADIVWFCDADHVFSTGIFDQLATKEWPADEAKDEGSGVPASMIFPQDILIHKDHQTGDEVLKSIAGFGIENISLPRLLPPQDFIPKHYHRAIGGVQIVKGDLAREIGYLDGNENWQQPNPDGVLRSFRDDIAYRKACLKHGPIIPVQLLTVYRLRHTETTYQ